MTKPSVACEVEITGVLARDACVTVLPNDHGTALPAIMLEMQSPLGNRVTVHWPRPSRDRAEQEAGAFKRGMPVRVTAPVRSHVLHVNGASKVDLTIIETSQRNLL